MSHTGLLAILTLHLFGFVIIAGATVGSWVADKALFARLPNDRAGAAAIAVTLRGYGLAAQIGAGVMLLSGLGLLFASKWAQWGSLWLSIKLALFVALGMFGGIVGGGSSRKLGALLDAGVANPSAPLDEAAIARLHGTRTIFHVVETLLFAVVIGLAVFKIV